jgi:hypothetical protein
VVLAPRRWRQVRENKFSLMTVTRKPDHRGERDISRKTVAQGKPGCLRWTCMLVCTLFCALRTRDRGCSAHPAFPAPSFFEGEDFQTSGPLGRENATHIRLSPPANGSARRAAR